MTTEDEVCDSAKIILGFDRQEEGVRQGTGQITTFNQLGIKGDGKDKKTDGYLKNIEIDVPPQLQEKSKSEIACGSIFRKAIWKRGETSWKRSE